MIKITRNYPGTMQGRQALKGMKATEVLIRMLVSERVEKQMQA
jgi:hypothetical protein